MPPKKKTKLSSSQTVSAYQLCTRTRTTALGGVDLLLLKLAFADEKRIGWKLTSGARVKERKDTGTYQLVFCLRGHEKDRRGDTKRFGHYPSALDAENAAFAARYELESNAAKRKLDLIKARCDSFIKGNISETDFYADEDESPTLPASAKATKVYKRKSLNMTGNVEVRGRPGHVNLNPFVPPTDYIHPYVIQECSARKVQRKYKLSRLRIMERLKKMKSDQLVRRKIISLLLACIKSKEPYKKLIVGGDDDEIALSFSQFDKDRCIMQAQMVCDALRYMHEMVETSVPCTWEDACSASARSNYDRVAGSTIMEWFRQYCRDGYRFPQSRRGHAKWGAKSPFAEDEGLVLQFKLWCRSQISEKKMSLAAATDYVNLELLANWSTEQLTRNRIKYPVSSDIVSRWMREADIRYGSYKKSYWVNRHNDPDVLEDKEKYLERNFELELQEACWIQITKAAYENLFGRKRGAETKKGESKGKYTTDRFVICIPHCTDT